MEYTTKICEILAKQCRAGCRTVLVTFVVRANPWTMIDVRKG